MPDSRSFPRKKPPLVKSKCNVMGLVHPYRPDYRVQGNVPAGTTVYSAIREACKLGGIRRKLINYGVAQIGKRDYEKQVTRWTFIPFSQWKKHKLAEDEILRFRILPRGGGGGGGGKDAVSTILSVVVAVVAVAAATFTAGASIFAAGGVLAGWGTFAGGLAGMAVLTIGQALVNAIAPVSAIGTSGISTAGALSQNKESSVYSISGGKNTVNQWGRVPVPVGRGRFAPPKAAAPYTQNYGDDQFLHELLCIGIGDIQCSGIKIGSTPIEDYVDAQWEIIRTDNNPVPTYYPYGVYEETLNIELKAGVMHTRTTQECNYADLDFSFNGLCEFDDYGNPVRAAVSFDISYRTVEGDSSWISVGKRTFVNGINMWKSREFGIGAVFVSTTGGIIVRMGDSVGEPALNEYRLGFYNVDGDGTNWRTVTFTQSRKGNGCTVEGFQVTTYSGVATSGQWGMSVASGYIVTRTEQGAVLRGFTVEGAQTRLLRRTYRLTFMTKGVYEVSVTRRTQDSNSSLIRDESYWTAIRSGGNERPVNVDYPVTLLSLMIRASGQISGAIDTLTIYYETKIADFNGSSWVWQYTSNSAAIMLYLLTQEHAWAFPQTYSKIDLESFQRAYRYADEQGFNYNKVLDASASLFDRLVEVGASFLASPTIIDGKWGVIIDAPRENVVCAFTSANAWNWSYARTQVKLPNSIHCNFINEATWESDMRVVETNEPLDGSYLYETQNYEGVTNPDQVWKLARFHYADAKRRRRTISFTAYDESILCKRGDLVELCCPNVGVQGLQAGRIRKVNKNASGYVTSITTDQLNMTDFSGRNFGVKIYANDGSIYHVRIKAEGKPQRLLTFQTATKINIQPGNKYAFGDYSEEVFQAIILTMKFNSDFTCAIECQDYDELLYGDLSGEIPDFESVITRPIEYKWTLYSIPIIVDLVSDESVLVSGSNGTLLCRILVYLADPPDLDERAAFYNIQIRKVIDPDSANPLFEAWRNAVRGEPIEQDSAYINDVDENVTYEIRARYTGYYGEYGPWCEPVRHKVIGTTTPPPDVTNFKATIVNPEGIWLTWDNIPLLDIHYYKIWGSAWINALASPYLYKPWRQTGLLEFWIVAVDRGGRESLHPSYASCYVYPPNDVIVTNAELLDEGVVASWQDAFTTWDIQFYRVKVREYTGWYKKDELSCIIPWSGRFYKNEPFRIWAYDIFENWGLNETYHIITIYPPLTPKIEVSFDITNGNVRIDWQDCKNPTKPNTPTISHYVLTGTLASGKPVEVKGLHYESIVPLIVYEFGAGSVEGGIPVNVGNIHIKVIAVDKYGITSEDADDYEDNSVDLELLPPYNPTDFGFSAVIDGSELDAKWTEGAAIMLTWRDCQRTLAISHYTVYDAYTDTTYKVATNYIILPVRPEGSYPITVQAFDVLGLSSAAMTYNMVIGGVGCIEVTGKIDGSDILLEWGVPKSPFQIDHYIVMQDNDDLPSGTDSDRNLPGYLGEAKFNFFRIPAGKAGAYVFYIWAVDVAGNVNTDCASYCLVEIDPNGPPIISAKVDGIGVALAWSRADVPNSLPVIAWDVRRYEHLDSAADIPLSIPAQDYGRLDVDKTKVDAFKIGDYTFAVRAIDSGGNEGEWGLCDFRALAPGQVMFTNAVVIDNNVQLYWTEPNFIFFEIKEYIFSEVQPDAIGNDFHMEIGRVDALFVSHLESDAGDYVYSITPVDWGGNRGTPTKISLTISQPPDFQYFDAFESLFNGDKFNMVLDGQGHLVGPFIVGETWIENRERASLLSGKDIVTHKDKVDAGYKVWPEPIAPYGTYTETIDHGAVIETCNYRVNIDWKQINGDPRFVCKIEVSIDGEIWRTLTENGTQVYTGQFRYSRITLTVTGGVVQIERLAVNLALKKVSDYGRVYCDKDDNGDGWISESETPMLTGTWVKFNQAFIDVQSLPKPNVRNNEDYTAYTVFEDVVGPRGFRIFVKDKNGVRVSAEVDWTAFGV